MKTAKKNPGTDWEAFGRGQGKGHSCQNKRACKGLFPIVVGLGGLLFYIFPLSRRMLHFAVSILYAQIPNTEFNHAVLGYFIHYVLYTLANILALPMLFSLGHFHADRWFRPEPICSAQRKVIDPKRLNPIKGFKEKFLSWQPVVEPDQRCDGALG